MRKTIVAMLVGVLSGSVPVWAADFNGDGTGDPAVFRPAASLWVVKGLTRFYFGSTGDAAVPGDYAGGSQDSAAIFRAGNGLWSVWNLTRAYFGAAGDTAVPGDFRGDGVDRIAVFRPSQGFWSVRDLTRVWFGGSNDQPLAPGRVGGPRQCLVPVTGQVTSYRTGDDGYHESGAPFDFDTFTIWGGKLTVDRNTGLVWAADGNEAGCNFGLQTDWAAAVRWCENLSFAGITEWRLANIRELETIVDYSRTYPPVDPAYFPNTKDDWYWSSTSTKNTGTWAWVMQFDVGGYVDDDAKANLHYIRAVAGPSD